MWLNQSFAPRHLFFGHCRDARMMRYARTSPANCPPQLAQQRVSQSYRRLSATRNDATESCSRPTLKIVLGPPPCSLQAFPRMKKRPKSLRIPQPSTSLARMAGQLVSWAAGSISGQRSTERGSQQKDDCRFPSQARRATASMP